MASLEEAVAFAEEGRRQRTTMRYNAANTYTWPLAQFFVLEADREVADPSSVRRPFTYFTQLLRPAAAAADPSHLHVFTFCPERPYAGPRPNGIWRVGRGRGFSGEGDPGAASCPHPLVGRRLRVSAMGNPPYVRPQQPPYGAEIRAMNLIADYMGFSVEFKTEGSYAGVVQAVRDNVARIQTSLANFNTCQYHGT